MLTVGNGLQGQYFDTADLTNPALVRTDANVNFNWGTGTPDSSLNADSFSVRWSGQVEAQSTEAHTFHVVANDGARLWVNGQLLIDSFEDSLTNASGAIDLISGRRYDIQLEYRENTGNASVRLEWSSASQSRQVIPRDYLFAGDRGAISFQRFNNVTGSAVSDLTSRPQFPGQPTAVGALTALESPVSIGNLYGARLAGFLHPPETGPYTFYIAGDQSAELWLSNSSDPDDRQRIASVASATGLRQWTASPTQQSEPVFLAAGQNYFIEVLHKESTGADHVSVGWVKPGQPNIEVVSGDYLSAEKPTVRGFAVSANATESAAQPATYQITRTGPTTNALVVDYRTSGDAVNGVDYQALSGSVTIPAGSDSVMLDITPLTDADNEGRESIVIELLHSQRYEVGFKSERTFNAVLLDDVEAPAGGTSLWNGTNLSAFVSYGGNFSTVADPTFGSVIQATIGNQSSPFNSQLRQTIDAPVAEGETLFAEFFVRSVGSTDGLITAIFEVNGAPFTKSLQQGMAVSSQWSKVQIPFSSVASYAAGEAAFGFFLGAQPQTIQFADFNLVNYGVSSALSPSNDLFLNNIGGTFGVSQTVPVSGQTFSTALEVQTTVVPPQVWRIQAQESNSVAVPNGETMRYEFSIRWTSGANPRTTFLIQDTTDNFSIVYNQTINLTSTWQKYTIDVPVTQAYGVGALSTVFNLGFGLQTVQIADFSWRQLGGNSVTLDQLPNQSPSSSYGGREADSDWRSNADQRIQDQRKSNATVNVVDANGLALEGAVVSLRQTDHEFLFGSAISAFNSNLVPNPLSTGQIYQDEINRLFNTVVVENSLKWEQYLGNEARGIEAVQFAVDNDLYVRGHNIIWPSRELMPQSVWDGYDSRVSSNGLTFANNWLSGEINARFDDVLNTFDGQITEWDIVNEPFTNRDVMDVLGDQVLVDWFQRVRDFDPDIQLTLNDFNIFTSNGSSTAHRADFETWLGLLNQADLLDVIGVQSHFTAGSLTDIDVLEGLITQYDAQFGQTISITEFDVLTTDEQLQADYLRDFLTQSFSQSGVSQFVQWGFWEGAHFQPDAALYRLDFSTKPNGQAYEDLVFGNWWSDVRGTTSDGSFSADVFKGQYDVVVQYDGQTFDAVLTVDDSGASSVSLALPVEAINYGAVISKRGVSYGNSNGFSETEVPASIDGLLPGQAASQANFTNYYLGLNRVVIEVTGLASSAIDSSDFDFRVGNTADPSQWALLSGVSAIALPTVSVVAGGAGQPDQVVLAWPDNVIQNTWLQVTMKANARTGLVADDVFYIGNQIGDVNGEVNAQNQIRVNSSDSTLARLNQSPTSTVGIDDVFDVDRNGRVNSFDVVRVALNPSSGGLLMFTPPVLIPVVAVTVQPLPIIVEAENPQPAVTAVTAVQDEEEVLTEKAPVTAVQTEAVPIQVEVPVLAEAVVLPAVEAILEVSAIETEAAAKVPASSAAIQPLPKVSSLAQPVVLAQDFTADSSVGFNQEEIISRRRAVLPEIAPSSASLSGAQELTTAQADEFFAGTDSTLDLDTEPTNLFGFSVTSADVSVGGKEKEYR